MPKKKPDTPASPPAHAISSALPSTCRPSCLSWRAAPLLNSQGRTPCRTWVQKSWSIVLGFELQFKKRMNPPSHTLKCDRLDRAESSKPSAAPRTKSSARNVTSRRSIAGQVLPIRTPALQPVIHCRGAQTHSNVDAVCVLFGCLFIGQLCSTRRHRC